MLGKAPHTFQGPLRVGQPAEDGSLREVPLEPLICAGSFANLWEGGQVAELGVRGKPQACRDLGLR